MPGHCAWRFTPRLGAAIGARGASAKIRSAKMSPPVILDERAPGVAEAAAASEAALLGRVDRERLGWRPKLALYFELLQARAAS
jgi:hypothetical protein